MDVLAPETYGAIKDPVDNFFEIDTSGIISENNIRTGILIATYCGFLQPQKVILEYEQDFN